MQAKFSIIGYLKKMMPLIVCLSIIAGGACFVGWVIVRVDREMRGVILQQISMAARAMDVGHVQSLSASQDDLYNPRYRIIKERLAAIREANPRCRFVYLLGRSVDWPSVRLPVEGRIFFLADSEPEDSKDYSPPGQAFDEDTAVLHGVFETQTGAVEGPVADRWGLWISALAPLTDPITGKVVAVLGMDVEAGDWRWDIAARAALPVGLLVVLLVGVATVTVARRRTHPFGASVDAESPEPVLSQLLPQLAALFVILLGVLGGILWRQHRQYLSREIEADIEDACGDMHVALDQEAVGMKTILQTFADDVGLQKDLRARDTDRLLAAWRPVFENLRQETQITHFYFHDTNRVCLLRLHKPERRGDTIDRQTILQAEHTGKSASGLELGPLGTFTLRVVQPVYASGELLGYVELGKEIEDAMKVMNPRSGIHLAVVLRKNYLNRQDWELGMRMLGRPPQWDLMAEGAVAYVSSDGLIDVLAAASDVFVGNHAHDLAYHDVTCNGKSWKMEATPLRDVAGREVADLLVLRDLTREANDFRYLLTLVSMVGLIILSLLISVSYVVLSHTDAGILAQQATLRASEGRFAQLAEQSRTITWEVDAQGLYTYVSHVAESVLGYLPEELVGKKHFYDLHPESGRDAFRRESIAVFEKRQTFHNMISAVECRDGHQVWVATYGMPILLRDGSLVGYRGSDMDITERRQADEALRRSSVNLKAMALRLQAVREEERAALARELHDSLAQQLTAFALQIELIAMDAQPLARRLPECSAVYDRIIAMVPQVERLTEQTQKICASLRPFVLDSLGLVAAIEWLVEGTAKESGLDCKVALPDCDVDFERTLALALFRVVQDALDMHR